MHPFIKKSLQIDKSSFLFRLIKLLDILLSREIFFCSIFLLIKELYTIKHCNCVIEYSFREDQNIDSEILMEDKSKSIENFNNDKSQMVFEIFDGHGGDEMSTFLQTNLANIYKQNLLLNKGNIILSLKNAFHDADDEMRGQLNIEGLGSTGTLVHLVRSNEDELEVYSANVGDSRVSLISPEHIIRLSYDHRTTDEKEKKRK